ncbi:MAG: transglutaminase domain-containing protein [Clostridia bacterium]|nr:transglutaminase domain-containing protein [Clostridia bacterium]
MNKSKMVFKNKNRETGFVILRPYSKWNSGLVVLFMKGVLSALCSLVVFNLIFRGFNIECDYALMQKIIFITTLVFSFLQINLAVMSVACAVTALKLYTYVTGNIEILKSGLMTMANQCYSIISRELNLPAVNGFDNVLSDTYLTVNSVTGVIAFIISVIMVIVVVRITSKLLFAVGMAVVFSLLSFFNCEISYGYGILFLMCFAVLSAISICGVDSFKFSIFSLLNKDSKRIRIKSDVLYGVQIAVIACIVFATVCFGFKLFYNEEKFEETFNSSYSENVKLTLRDIAVIKYAEYKKFNFEQTVSLGQLGYVSYVKPDFKGRVFRFVTEPITEGKIYFASFIGQDYKYRYNTWTESEDDNSVMVNALKNEEADDKKFEIYTENHISYYPVYSEYVKYDYNDKNKAEITSYEYKNVKINDENYNQYVNTAYLNIDVENKAVIDKICAEEGFSKDDRDIDQKLAQYLKSNFTYSTEVNSVPYGKDFVNYFLEESKTGNFTQYASALTLIYRNLGIPARYVSGYAVEAGQILAGERAGENRTSTLVKKANMYSWVEVYNSDGGWRKVDIIPAPGIKELEEKYGDDAESTYIPDTSLNNYFRTIDKEKYSPENITKAGAKLVIKIIVSVMILTALIIAAVLLFVFIYKFIIYSKADNSKKAYIMMENLKKKLRIKCTSYRDAEKYIAEKYGAKKAHAIITLAEECIFNDSVDNEDIKNLKKLINGKNKGDA